MFKRTLSVFILVFFSVNTLCPQALAQVGISHLPKPGMMVPLSAAYQPVMIKGVTIHKDNPFLFDFIVDLGQDFNKTQALADQQQLKREGERLIKYFLASLAVPEADQWVNLSPYEKNKILPEALGQTTLGRDLLAQDYILKQVTASLMYPEGTIGKEFWNKVYAKVQAQYGDVTIPVNTFNKVWIMADKAEVFEQGQTVIVTKSHLKVMLEEDYLATKKNNLLPTRGHVPGAEGGRYVHPHAGYSQRSSPRTLPSDQGLTPKAPQGNPLSMHQPLNQIGKTPNAITKSIIKEIMLPALETEVNQGKNFAALRQIFNAAILANWYKNNLKQSLLNQVYSNRSKVSGTEDKKALDPQKVYEQYVKAYQKGVFNYISTTSESAVNGKVDLGEANAKIKARKYFSGGTSLALTVQQSDPTALRNASFGSLVSMRTGFSSSVAPLKDGGRNEAMVGKIVEIKYNAWVNMGYIGVSYGFNEVKNTAELKISIAGSETLLDQSAALGYAFKYGDFIFLIGERGTRVFRLTNNTSLKPIEATQLPEVVNRFNYTKEFPVTVNGNNLVSGDKTLHVKDVCDRILGSTDRASIAQGPNGGQMGDQIIWSQLRPKQSVSIPREESVHYKFIVNDHVVVVVSKPENLGWRIEYLNRYNKELVVELAAVEMKLRNNSQQEMTVGIVSSKTVAAWNANLINNEYEIQKFQLKGKKARMEFPIGGDLSVKYNFLVYDPDSKKSRIVAVSYNGSAFLVGIDNENYENYENYKSIYGINFEFFENYPQANMTLIGNSVWMFLGMGDIEGVEELKNQASDLYEKQANISLRLPRSTDLSQAMAAVNGGIDLAQGRNDWTISREGAGVQMTISPAMMASIKTHGIGFLTPVIMSISPLENVQSIFTTPHNPVNSLTRRR